MIFFAVRAKSGAGLRLISQEAAIHDEF